VDAFIIVPVPAQDAGQEISLPIDASCTCPAVPQNECSLNSIPCTVDTECPSSWTCVTPPVAICGCPNIVLLDGSTPPCDCPEASSSGGSCVPPNWTPRSGSSSTGSGSVPLSFGDASAEDGGVAPGATTGGNDGTIDGGGSSSSSGGSSPRGSSSFSSGGGEVFVDAGHGVASYPGDAAGATGATGTGTSSGPDAAVSTGGGSGPSAASNSNDQAKDSSSGGCQIGEGRGASSVPGFFGMALLAIGASALRRRRVSPQRVR
jgi:MYXO-CTERM domain-containing protein